MSVWAGSLNLPLDKSVINSVFTIAQIGLLVFRLETEPQREDIGYIWKHWLFLSLIFPSFDSPSESHPEGKGGRESKGSTALDGGASTRQTPVVVQQLTSLDGFTALVASIWGLDSIFSVELAMGLQRPGNAGLWDRQDLDLILDSMLHIAVLPPISPSPYNDQILAQTMPKTLLRRHALQVPI